MPVKPLSFKGDKPRPKKRKHHESQATPTTASYTADHSAADQDDEDTWVDPDSITDLSGPVILVLPTQPPTCIASDAHGNVFASILENMVEGNPVTAEPHDVRQVWIANRVAGTNEGAISLKGSHGGYLSCDESGILGAHREARGFEESFTVESISPEKKGDTSSKGSWRLKTAAAAAAAAAKNKDDKKGTDNMHCYLSAIVEGGGDASAHDNDEVSGGRKKISISLRGDGRKDSGTTELILRMQARFKPKLQRDKEQKKSEKVSRAELERIVGRRLDEDEVKRLKRAKKDGTYHEEILDVRVKGKHDKFA